MKQETAVVFYQKHFMSGDIDSRIIQLIDEANKLGLNGWKLLFMQRHDDFNEGIITYKFTCEKKQ